MIHQSERPNCGLAIDRETSGQTKGHAAALEGPRSNDDDLDSTKRCKLSVSVSASCAEDDREATGGISVPRNIAAQKCSAPTLTPFKRPNSGSTNPVIPYQWRDSAI